MPTIMPHPISIDSPLVLAIIGAAVSLFGLACGAIGAFVHASTEAWKVSRTAKSEEKRQLLEIAVRLAEKQWPVDCAEWEAFWKAKVTGLCKDELLQLKSPQISRTVVKIMQDIEAGKT